jgi:hypothetical protein
MQVCKLQWVQGGVCWMNGTFVACGDDIGVLAVVAVVDMNCFRGLMYL